MDNTSNMMIKKLTSIFVLTILMLNLVLAFGVTTPYWDTNPGRMHPGETRDIQLEMQNMVGDKDLVAKLTITEGTEIIKLLDSSDTYNVPLGERTYADLRITIPSDAEIGDVYPVSIQVSTSTPSESGTLGIGVSVDKKFEIIVDTKPPVQKSPETTKRNMIYIVLGIIILAVIIYFVKKRKNDSPSKAVVKK